MTKLSGVFNIMATPFTSAGAVDVPGLKQLTEFQIRAGATGLTVLGMMGEAHKLRDFERALVIETVMQATSGRVPVVVGVSHSGTDAAAGLANEAEAAGAAAVMAAPPVLLKGKAAIVTYYECIATSINIPVVIQDEPVQTGVQMPADLLAELTDQIDGCRYIKLEEAPTPFKITQVLKAARRPVSIFGGLGGVQFYYELCRGAVGTMTGFAYTETLVDIYNRFAAGDRQGAAAVFYRYLPVIAYEGQPGIGLALRKELLRKRGAISHAGVRHPAVPLDEDTIQEMLTLLLALGLDKSFEP